MNKEYKKAVFAGGCFWCIADKFYSLNGVIDVFSGYTGGNLENPSYLDVKNGDTGHKEAIMILYDETVVSYMELVKTYFESIDPFDDDGQFIDRGDSYQTAIFTNDETEIDCIKTIIKDIEKKYLKEVKVKILEEKIFYLAEEEHQRYSLKNPDAFEEEENKSGRNDFKWIKL